MNHIVNYINKELGMSIEITPVNKRCIHNLPTFLTSMYCLFSGKIHEQSVIFARYMPEIVLAPSNYAKHERMLRQVFNDPIIFVFNQIQSYNKKRISDLGINYIVSDSVIHLPELFIILSKTAKKDHVVIAKPLTPTAQTVLLYYLYNNKNDLSYKQLQESLGMPYPTVCRTIEILKTSKLCRVVGSRDKTIQFDVDKIELFNRALPLMKSPVKRVIYSETVPNLSYKTGMTALSEYTMINPDVFEHVAISYGEYKQLKDYSIEDNHLPIHIEVWDYDPSMFAQKDVVDVISLYLSLKDNQDERIHYELNQIIQHLW